MKKVTLFLAPFFLFSLFGHFASPFATRLAAQERAVDLVNVQFDSLRNDWIRFEVEIEANENPLPDARERNYLDRVKVTAYAAWTRDAENREFDYYKSDVEIVSMERGDRNNVYFYLPGLIAERDRLREEPDFYYFEISHAGEAQDPKREALSDSIPNPDVLESFLSRVESELGDNKDLLMPVYLVPSGDRGRIEDLPTFLRRDVEAENGGGGGGAGDGGE